MLRILTVCLLLFAGAFSSRATPATNALSAPLSTDQLDERLEAIDAELETLASYSFRSGSGSIGYRSKAYYTSEKPEWIKIDFEKEQPIDEIVLVPVLRRDSKTEFKPDAFPAELHIWAGTAEDPTGTLITTITNIQSRIAPLIISVPHLEASWIRIETPLLTQRGFDERFIVHLAEVLVFSGEENVALHRPVTVSTSTRGHSYAWAPEFLVDGHMPYLMDTAQGRKTLAFIGLAAEPPSLTIDLRETVVLSRIHLHAVDQSDLVPLAYFSDYGMPLDLRIEGATHADFSDAQLLLETRRESIIETGPIMMWRLPETKCRYVRITAPTPDPNLHLPHVHLWSLSKSIDPKLKPIDENSALFRVGYAEIELFSKGVNRAKNKPVTLTNLPAKIQSSPEALTDGSNLYGEILPVREWMHQLARRHALEAERPLIIDALNGRNARQRTNLQRMYWLSGTGTLFAVAGLITTRLIHRRRMKAIKQRIAADLHDELGANLHAIGLIGDLAKMEFQKADQCRQEQMIKYLDEVRILTEASGSSTRYVSHMLDTGNYHANLIQEMKHTAERFLSDLHHKHSFPPDQALQHLHPKTRIDLYLFYKECLTNIIRHADASEVHSTLQVTGTRLTLTVADDGIGLDGTAPPSLKRRAQLMRGKVLIERPDNGGTIVTLMLRIRKTPS
ncbi:histidine kinase [Pontiellaceae bacterium B1224]|nr:histidine kinase [Pontiellaceae bacterium B1224]